MHFLSLSVSELYQWAVNLSLCASRPQVDTFNENNERGLTNRCLLLAYNTWLSHGLYLGNINANRTHGTWLLHHTDGRGCRWAVHSCCFGSWGAPSSWVRGNNREERESDVFVEVITIQKSFEEEMTYCHICLLFKRNVGPFPPCASWSVWAL